MIEDIKAPTPFNRTGKVAAAIIAYQAAEYITDLLDSLVGHVDCIVMGIDTKTTDDTRAVVEAWVAAGDARPEVVLHEHTVGEDFAAARNVNFAHLPQDTDWVLWIDADDVFGAEMNLKRYLFDMPRNVNCVWLPYLYNRNEQGDVDTLFHRERIFRYAAGPIWKGRVHEWCEFRVERYDWVEGKISEGAEDAHVWVEHKNWAKKKPETVEGRNIRLLQKCLEDDPKDIRAILYLGHSYFGALRWSEAAAQYVDYCAKAGGGALIEEVYQARIWASRAYRNAQNLDQALRTAEQAMMQCPEYQDAYVEISWNLLLKREWEKCIQFHETGLRKKRLNTILIHNPLDYTFNPYSIAHVAYFQMGRYQEAIDCITKCLEYRPKDDDIRFRGMYYLSAFNRAKAIEASKILVRHLLNTNEPIKAEEVLARVPAGALEEDETLRGLQAEVADRLHHLRDEVRYVDAYTEEFEVVKATREEVDSGWKYPRMKWIVEQLKKYGAKRVLDVGIGNGVCDFMMAEAGINVLGIEVDWRRVQEANFASVELGFRKLRPAPEHTTIPAVHAHNDLCDGHQVECYGKERLEGALPLICGKPDEGHCTFVVHSHEEWTEGCEVCGPVRMLPDMEQAAPVRFEPIPNDGTIPEKIRALGPFDAVVVAELVEHVTDPGALLALYERVNWRYVEEGRNGDQPVAVLKDVGAPAPLMLVTTPDGAWRGPQAVNRLHVKMWSRGEFEGFLAPHGWLQEVCVVDHPGPGQGNLCAVYDPKLNLRSKPPVTYWCGPHLEPWSPDTLWKEGVGGSETAVIYCARDTAFHEYRAMVYTVAEGIWEGVRYRNYKKWRPDRPSWLFISWRRPDVFDLPIQANLKALWVHDIDQGDNLTAERARKIDVIYCLSGWHRRHLMERYPFLKELRCAHDAVGPHDELCYTQVVVVGNGIDHRRFNWRDADGRRTRTTPRTADRFLWTSAPDRGLEQTLTYWPLIREALPKAELHIFYGWEYYDRMHPNPGPFKQKMLDLGKQPGVVWRGRVGQQVLADEMMDAGVWLYPGPHPFAETFCISAVEAQAAGCVPVTRDNGALPEVNVGGILLANDRPAADWVAAAISATTWSTHKRAQMAERVRDMSWAHVNKRMIEVAKLLTDRLIEREKRAQEASDAVESPA